MLQLQVEDEQGVNVCTESSLTLRRLLVWMYDPKVRLKTLAALVDFCQGGWIYLTAGFGGSAACSFLNVPSLRVVQVVREASWLRRFMPTGKPETHR